MGKSSKKSGPKVDSAAVVAKPSPKSLKKGRAEAIDDKSVSNKKQKVEEKKIEVIPEEEETTTEEETDSEVDAEEDGEPASSRTLYVGNLPYDAGRQDVEKFFESAGRVVAVRLAVADGKSRGFGHVEFATEEAAKKALKELNGRELLNRAVRLDMDSGRKSKDVANAEIEDGGESASSRTLFVGNLPYDVGREDVEKFFESAGRVVEVRLAVADGKPRGFGHVQYATVEEAKKALKELNGRELLNRAVRLDMESGRKTKDVQEGGKSQSATVFVRGFGKDDSEVSIRSSLEKHFGSCGEITRIAIPKDPMGGVKGIAYIDFTAADSCAGALELSGSQLGGQTLYVDQAKPKSNSAAGGRGGGRGRGGRGRGRGGDRGGRRGRGRGRRN